MIIQPVSDAHGEATRELLRVLRVSLFGIGSPRLHRRLVHDAIRRRIDGRIAVEGSDVLGLVLAAPARYWRWLPLTDWPIAINAAVLRFRPRVPADTPLSTSAGSPASSPWPAGIAETLPSSDWGHPGDAWRVIFVGTSPLARGRGVAAALYRQIMADRSLVARIALENEASLRLHASTGWRLYRDHGVVLAVHDRHDVNRAPMPVGAPHEGAPPASDSDSRGPSLRS